MCANLVAEALLEAYKNMTKEQRDVGRIFSSVSSLIPYQVAKG